MKLKQTCKTITLARLLPFCTAALALCLACLLLGGGKTFALFKQLDPPLALAWNAPPDTRVDVSAAFIFEQYSMLEIKDAQGNKEEHVEFLMTDDWNNFYGVSFSLTDFEIYLPLIEQMHAAAREGTSIASFKLTGIFEDMPAESTEHFNALIEEMGFSSKDEAISHKVLRVGKEPYRILPTYCFILFVIACVFMLVFILLFMLSICGFFQISLSKTFDFTAEHKTDSDEKENDDAKNETDIQTLPSSDEETAKSNKKISYEHWQQQHIKAGDLYLSKDILVFHSFAWVICLRPASLAKVLSYPEGKSEKEKSNKKYLYLYSKKGHCYKVLTGEKGKTEALQYIFENFPNIVSI